MDKMKFVQIPGSTTFLGTNYNEDEIYWIKPEEGVYHINLQEDSESLFKFYQFEIDEEYVQIMADILMNISEEDRLRLVPLDELEVYQQLSTEEERARFLAMGCNREKMHRKEKKLTIQK